MREIGTAAGRPGRGRMPSQIRQATSAQFAEHQSHGLDVLLSLATPKDVREYARAYDGGSLLARRGGSDRSAYGYSDAPVLPQRSQLSRYVEPRPRPLPRKAPPLERFGEPAPVVTYRPRQWLACLPVAMLIAGSFALHYRLVRLLPGLSLPPSPWRSASCPGVTDPSSCRPHLGGSRWLCRASTRTLNCS